MSRKRNRSVRTLPLNTVLPQFPAPDKSPVSVISHKEYNVDKNCFGEPVKKSPSAYALYYKQLYSKKNDNVDSIFTGVRNLSFKSSSSSLSWSDEYESESCQKIQDELDKIENVLCGIGSVTEPYDEAEIKEWMEMFPNLRIFGKLPPHKSSLENAHQENPYKTNTIFEDCDEETTSSSDKSDNNIWKLAVINTLYDNVINRLTKRESHKIELKVQKTKFNKPKNKLVDKTKNPLTTIEIDHYLKVSPIPQRKHHIPKCLDVHKNSAFFINPDMSSANLVNSDLSSAKWLKSDSPEYNSLPFLTEELSVKGTQSGGDAHRKKNKRSPSKTKQRNSFVLPPIESPRMVSDHFRSVSAIPAKQNNKCLSAFSVKLDKELGESKLDFSKYLKTHTSVKITRSRIPRIYKRWDSIDN